MASAEAVPSTSAALSRRTRFSPEHFCCREGSSTPHIWPIPRDRCVRGRRHRTVCPAGVLGTVAIQAAITPDAAVLLFARMLIGLAIGADSAIAIAYVAE